MVRIGKVSGPSILYPRTQADAFPPRSMPYGQRHYPFENKEQFHDAFPADFVCEGIDQTRGWFYTMLVLGTHLFGTAPWKNLIVHGLILAGDGKKMSKKLKNYPDPDEIIDKYGSDALRWVQGDI